MSIVLEIFFEISDAVPLVQFMAFLAASGHCLYFFEIFLLQEKLYQLNLY